MRAPINKTEMLQRYRDGDSRNRYEDDTVLKCMYYLDSQNTSVELRDTHGKKLSYERQLAYAFDMIFD